MAKSNKLTPEMKKKLAGLLPCNNDFTVEYTPESVKELDKEFQYSFTLKPWNNNEMTNISKKMSGTPDDSTILDLIRKQIVGLNNLINLSTEECVEYAEDDKGSLTKEIFDTVPQRVKLEIFTELTRISGIKV